MNKVILQPCSNKIAYRHYQDTIENAVDLSFIREYVTNPSDLSKLEEFYPDGKVPTWGVTSGTEDYNVQKWDRIETGDISLFAAHGRVFASAVVTHKIRNADLAAALWEYDGSGQTWEYIYFLTDVKAQYITYQEFNKVVGYQANALIRDFRILSDDKSLAVISAFDFSGDADLPSISEAEFKDAVKDLENIPQIQLDPNQPLDKLTLMNVRTEQGFLRNYLFKGRKIARCGICDNEFPRELLTASHIKRRAECTLEEKLDYQYIVMPMCNFGCDDLYERGYISVRQGKITLNKGKIMTDSIKRYLERIDGLDCIYWNDQTSKYFDWHYDFHS